FYERALGLTPPAGATEGYPELDASCVRLALHAIPAFLADRIHIAHPPDAREDTPVKLAFHVTHPANARTRIAERDAVLRERRAADRCDALDPEGNVFQIFAT